MDYVVFTLIVDDIVQPSGRTAMACLGGGGEHRFANTSLGLAAGVGEDLPPACRAWLAGMGVDLTGLIAHPHPTLRAWQLFEECGRRTQVWRVPEVDAMWQMLRPPLSSLPPLYQRARAYHAGVHPSGQDVDFIRSLRTGGGGEAAATVTPASICIWQVVNWTLAVVGDPSWRLSTVGCGLWWRSGECRALVSSADIFSPNEEEAFSLVGPGPPLEVLARLLDLGAQIVTLRRGQEGCVVLRADTGEAWQLPALYGALSPSPSPSPSPSSSPSASPSPSPSSSNAKQAGLDDPQTAEAAQTGASSTTTAASGDPRVGTSPLGDASWVSLLGVVDPTGCGNAFCGGFLVGWLETDDLLTAGLYGSVAASFSKSLSSRPTSRSGGAGH
eukprot:jgi/Mesen1/5645/ME000286S04855